VHADESGQSCLPSASRNSLVACEVVGPSKPRSTVELARYRESRNCSEIRESGASQDAQPITQVIEHDEPVASRHSRTASVGELELRVGP
jgi:hypothetical protein